MRRSGTVAVLAAVLLAVTGAPAFAAPSEALVTNGSPAGPFSQNKQNEPAVAVDANHPTVLAAGSNDLFAQRFGIPHPALPQIIRKRDGIAVQVQHQRGNALASDRTQAQRSG